MKRILMLLSLSALLLLAACGDSPAAVDTPADADTSAGTDAPDGAASDSAPSSDMVFTSDEVQSLYDDTEAKDEIKASVEALVADEYKGQSYSCDILTLNDASGYNVSLQIDVSVEPPESTDIIKSIEDAITALNDDRIAQIDIMASKDMKIVDMN